jgi:glucose/arabinose dehydrogenase
MTPTRRHPRGVFIWRLACAGALALAGPGAAPVTAAALPEGFSEVLLAQELDSPTAIDVLPDGRILVGEQSGDVRLIPPTGGGSSLLHHFSVNSVGERGLLGVVVDPGFAQNGFVYVYYTTSSGGLHNRISRLRISGNQTVGGEAVVFEFPNFSQSVYHMGGAMRFAPDGTLFVGVGDHQTSANAQDLGVAFGKIHRLASDGSIPSDNPFVGAGNGALPSIYAFGLRNPYSLDVNPSNGELLINDVGQSTWEEINLGEPGADYGWPDSEGAGVGPGETAPIHAYRHQGGACAITGGAAYPSGGSFPSRYWGDYLFIDLCAGWIRDLDRGSGNVTTFATGLDYPTALRLDGEGRILYLTRGAETGTGDGAGKLFRISYSIDPSLLPQIVEPPTDLLVGVGESAAFTVVASGATGYQWLRDGVAIPGATQSTFQLDNVSLSDDGARFRVRLSNAHGSVLSAEAVLSVTTNHAPAVTILSPGTGSGYEIGSTLALEGSALDPEEGAVPAARLIWRIDLHHDGHVHPLMPATSGFASLEFVVPPEAAHGDGLIWLEVVLVANDTEGRSGEASSHVFPAESLAGESEHVLALRGGDYLVSLEFQNPLTGLPQTAISWPQTFDSGGFWFFEPDNLEVLLKVLDGTGYNGCRWIFFGALSNVEFDFFIVETATGDHRAYSNPESTQASFGDIEAFCEEVTTAAAPARSDIGATSSLDLLGGRFRLTVEWQSPWSGDAGVAAAVPLTDQSGFFTFFDPSNLEMAVKMVDGTDYNGHFWVYWTALTNLETVLTVEDLFAGRTRTFPKAGSTFGAGADILAFPAD